jgi:predicted transcriptional regulator
MCIFAIAATGCAKESGNKDAASGKNQEEQPEISLKYPSNLSAESTPKEVAGVLIRALDEDDEATLLGLVAAKAEAESVNEIYRKHGRNADTRPETAARLVALGWRATYVFFQEGKTEVVREVVTGDTADVFAGGKAPDGKERTLKIRLLREDGLWKVRAGLQSLPGRP